MDIDTYAGRQTFMAFPYFALFLCSHLNWIKSPSPHICLPFCRAISLNEPVPDLSDTFLTFFTFSTHPTTIHICLFDAIFIKLSKLGSAFHLCLFFMPVSYTPLFWHCQVCPFFLVWHIKRKSLNSLQLTAGLWGNSKGNGRKKSRLKKGGVGGGWTQIYVANAQEAATVVKGRGRMFGHIKHTHCCAPRFPFPSHVKN